MLNKKQLTKRGISLIVLVITIIIMIILATAIIVSLNSSNIIEKVKNGVDSHNIANIVESINLKLSEYSLTNPNYSNSEAMDYLISEGLVNSDDNSLCNMKGKYYLKSNGNIEFNEKTLYNVNLTQNSIDLKVVSEFAYFSALGELDVIVNDGKVNYYSEAKKIQSITANTPTTGKKFGWWESESMGIISYDESVSNIKPYTNDTYTAVYVDENKVVEKNNIIKLYANTSLLKNDNKIAYIALFDNAAENISSVTSRGVILTNNKQLAESDGFNIYSADVLKVTSTNTSKRLYTTTRKANVQLNEVWYSKAWIEYVNTSGQTIVEYSDMLSSSLGQ